MRLPNVEPSQAGTLIWPSLGGGSNRYSSTYNPKTDLYYVNVKEMGAIYIKGDAEYRPGAQFNGGGQTDYQGEDVYGAVRALEVATGELPGVQVALAFARRPDDHSRGPRVRFQRLFVLRVGCAEWRFALAVRDRGRHCRQSD